VAFPDTLLSNQWGTDADPPTFIPPSLMNNRIDANLNALATRQSVTGMGRIVSSTFATDLTSAGLTEVVGYSQSVSLVSGRRYRVFFNAYMNGGVTAGQGRVQLRYDASTLTITSTAIGSVFGTITVSTSNAFSVFFFREFVASGTGSFNVGVGVRTASGAGNTVISGTVIPAEITIDDVGL